LTLGRHRVYVGGAAGLAVMAGEPGQPIERKGFKMPTDILNRIYAAVDYISNLDGQDTTLALEMSQQMISDLINTGAIRPILDYVRRYCDVIDGPEDAQRIADDI